MRRTTRSADPQICVVATTALAAFDAAVVTMAKPGATHSAVAAGVSPVVAVGAAATIALILAVVQDNIISADEAVQRGVQVGTGVGAPHLHVAASTGGMAVRRVAGPAGWRRIHYIH
mmetsp:Transcript_385/g.736  ORF Transcript_385/g.736 Transcript_385/m.736 type:complete len:117 (-) Transcript_385:518-868(-)